MKHHIYHILFILVCISLFEDVIADNYRLENLPEIKAMPGMKLEWVANPIIYNSNLMSIRNFSTFKNKSAVLRFYASVFKLKGHGILKISSYGNEKTIGYESNGYLYSVQVKEAITGSEGSLVVSRMLQVKNIKPVFPVRDKNKVLTHMLSFDAGVETSTLFINSSHSISANKIWYRKRLGKQGWSRYVSNNKRDIYEEQYQKGRQYCQIIYSKAVSQTSSRTLIQIHWVKG